VRVALHQPHYLPWLGLIDKIDRSDLLVVLDQVQYARNGWQNRNYVAAASGPILLTIPVVRGEITTRITDKVVNNNQNWREKHLRTLTEQCYARAPFWREFREPITAFYATRWERLADAALASTRLVLDGFGITTPLVRASTLGTFPGGKSELLAQICAKVGATTMLSGDGARDYLDTDLLRGYGVEVEWQDFRHPRYPQHARAGRDFLPRMAALDLLLNTGPDGLRLLRAARSGTAAGPPSEAGDRP
jgi:hypothetical protein